MYFRLRFGSVNTKIINTYFRLRISVEGGRGGFLALNMYMYIKYVIHTKSESDIHKKNL